MDFETLKLFLHIASTGSFSRAALLSDVTQSTASKRILSLELALGHRLFDRNGRGARLTEPGRQLVGLAETLVGDAENLRDTLHTQLLQPQGLVRIGIQASIAWPLVMHLHTQVRRRFPLVRMQVSEGPTRIIVESMQDGRIDIAVVSEWGQEQLPQVMPLFTSRLLLVGAANDPFTNRPSIPLAKMAGLPLILSPIPNGPRVMLEESSRIAGIALNVVLEAHSIHMIKRMVREGAGYTVTLKASVFEEVKQGSLSVAQIKSPNLEQKFFMSVTNLRKSSGATAAVARLLRELSLEVPGVRAVCGAPT